MDFLGTRLCLNWRRQKIKTQKRRESRIDQNQIKSIDQESIERQRILRENQSVVDMSSSDNYTTITTGDNISGEAAAFLLKLDRKMTNVEVLLKSLTSSIDRGDSGSDLDSSIKLEWRTLTAALDRLFFLIFLILNIVSLCLFYPRKLYD